MKRGIMDPLTTVLTAVEDTQLAKQNGAAKLASDQAKALAFANTITQDTSDQADLTTKADAAIDAAVEMLQSLKSTTAVVVA